MSTSPPSYSAHMQMRAQSFQLTASTIDASFQGTKLFNGHRFSMVSRDSFDHPDYQLGYRKDDVEKKIFVLNRSELEEDNNNYPLIKATISTVGAGLFLTITTLFVGILFANPIAIGVGAGTTFLLLVVAVAVPILLTQRERDLRSPLPPMTPAMTDGIMDRNGKYKFKHDLRMILV